MDIKTYLHHYGSLIRRIEDCKQRIKNEYTNRAEILESHLRIPSTDGVRVQGGKESDPVYRTVEKLMDYSDERILRLRKELNDLLFEFDEIRRSIERAELTEKETRVLEMEFIERHSAAEIAEKMAFSSRQIKRIKKAMFGKIEKQI